MDRTTTEPSRAAYSVDEFCVAFRLSRALFYKLLAEGRGPAIMKVGARTLVSTAAADAWCRQLEAAAHAGTAA
jgi:hypothetical protein